MRTKKIVKVGKVSIGANNKIAVQSMCNFPTKEKEKVVEQINELASYGCDIIRFSILDMEDADAIPYIKEHTSIPLVADIHFDYRLALRCIENGIDGLRINPGNIGSIDRIKLVVSKCKERHIPIRIGVNAGSLENDIKNRKDLSLAEKMVQSAKKHVDILESLGFYDIVISLKSSDPLVTKEAYEIADKVFDYPLHIGVTETGNLFRGLIRSSIALVPLLENGIGDTIRISLSADPKEEVRASKELLNGLGLIDAPTLISCPTCGRTTIDVIELSNELDTFMSKINKNIKVAVMGCPVNGIGEASSADIGISGANGQYIVFKKGKVVFRDDKEKSIEYLKKEIQNF